MFPKYDATMTVAALTAIYNSVAAKPIKKFTDKPTAIKRLAALEAEHKAAETVKRITVTAFIRTNLALGHKADWLVEQLLANYGDKAAGRDAATARKHVAWHASKLKQEGK